jgi:hypothetical protein
MKDVTGKELDIGNKVATNIQGYTYSLVICTIIGFTNQKVKLSYINDWSHKPDECLKFPKQLCKVE